MKMRTFTPLIGLALATGLTMAAPAEKSNKPAKGNRGEPA